MKKILLTCALALGISACSSAPSHIIISPEVSQLSSNLPSLSGQSLSGKSLALTVEDFRANHHLVQILKEGKAATLINGQSQLTELIKTSLLKSFKQQGINLNSASQNQLKVTIQTALINVEQTLFNYTTKSNIELIAELNNGNGTITKNYRVNGSSKGPLKPDLAVLGRDFNQQLGKALTRLLTDPELLSEVK